MEGIHILYQLASGHCKLNHYLSNIGVDTLPECVCGEREDVDHFLFDCECYSRYRYDLVQQMNLLCETNMANLKSFSWKTILGQERSYGRELNGKIVEQVIAFIRKTKRLAV